MLVRLDPAELRVLAGLLDEAGEDLDTLVRAAAAQGWPPPTPAAVLRVARWAGDAAGLIRRRAGLAEAGERLPAVGLATPAGPALRAGLEAVLRAAPRDPRRRAAAVRRHVGGLSPGERSALVVAAPELVGPLDGVPEHLRYSANHLLLRRALAAEERREAALPPTARTGAPGALSRRRLAGLRALLRPRRGADGRPMPRQWLALDLAGPGRGVEVVGATAVTARLDEARAVAVAVPGMGSRLLPPAPGWTDGAGRLAAEAARLTGPGTVVVAWQGYAAPQGVDVLSSAAARPAGAELAGFLHVLADATPGPVAVLGHSYGSVVVAAAARASLAAGAGPLPVDAVAVYGSPGLGRDVRAVADLRLARGTEVYALAAPLDAVAWSGWHGDNPVEADMGAVWLATGDIEGHSAYLQAGSTSLAGLALVAAGRGAAARRAPHAPDGGPGSAALADLRARRGGPCPAG